MMPPLTGLGIGRIVIFYIYAAPTALLADILLDSFCRKV
jgi:hypothetical protein